MVFVKVAQCCGIFQCIASDFRIVIMHIQQYCTDKQYSFDFDPESVGHEKEQEKSQSQTLECSIGHLTSKFYA